MSTRSVVNAIIAMLLFVMPAVAVENDDPNAAQTSDLPKKYPAAMKALRGIIPKNMQGEDWLWNLNGVGMALMDKDMGGVQYIAGWGCKPKFCAQNIVGFLVTADGKKAIAAIMISSKTHYLGKPSAAEKKALDGLIN